MTSDDSHRFQFFRVGSPRGVATRAIVATTLVLGGFTALGVLPAVYAIIGLAIIIAVVPIGAMDAPVIREAVPTPRPMAEYEENRLIEMLIAALNDPAMALDRNGAVVAYNGGAIAVAPGLRKGMHVSMGLRIPEVLEAVRSAAATGQVQRVEFSERVPVDRWYEAHVAPIASESRAGLMMMTLRDLTPLHRVEQMRADFIANASHELRTPLAALTGFIETLEGPARDDSAARTRFLSIMKDQASRMARLIDDLLSLSRIELNEHVRPEAPVDLVAVVRQVIDTLQTLARDRAVEIAIIAPAGPLIVPGDRDELVRVCENLIENALKYGASGKLVEVRISRGTDGANDALLSVKDQGPGIAPEHLPRLTERFYRVDVGLSRSEGGTGLGLAIVKHIVNRHHGRLLIDSKVGQGATFTVQLPSAPASTAAA